MPGCPVQIGRTNIQPSIYRGVRIGERPFVFLRTIVHNHPIMRRRFLKTALVILIYFGSLTSLAHAIDQYWLCYNTFSEGQLDYPQAGPKFLMKFDILGNVVIPPQVIVRNSSVYISPVGGADTLSQGKNETVEMWSTAKRSKGPDNQTIFKAVIDKKTLKLLSFKQTNILTAGLATPLVVTQKKFNNFIVLERPSNQPDVGLKIVGHDLANKRPNWFLLDCLGGTCDFALSADGRAFFYRKSSGQNSDLFLQPLNPAGIPAGDPQKIAEGIALLGDVSNIVQSNKRYCVYVGIGAGLFLQVVDSKTGAKLGERKKIANLASNPIIDPLGRFVIFSSAGGSVRFLKFQALDSLGNSSGNTRTILPDGFGGGLDILRDQ